MTDDPIDRLIAAWRQQVEERAAADEAARARALASILEGVANENWPPESDRGRARRAARAKYVTDLQFPG